MYSQGEDKMCCNSKEGPAVVQAGLGKEVETLGQPGLYAAEMDLALLKR